jgi:HlyD family secretion protein
MKRGVVIAVIAIIAAIAIWQVSARAVRGGEEAYRFVEVTRGDIANTIAATGTIEAVGTVEVGTQVSGIIDDVFADYNDQVDEGQVLAILDTVLLSTSVTAAEAGLLTARAQHLAVQSDHARTRELHERGLVSKADLEDSEAALMTAEGSVLSATAALKRAEANLDYAVIKSPISGTIIQRNIEEGQTVAASLSTPTLFMVAEDLSEMEIHVLVDESDIGQIEIGQSADFTVSAYVDREFQGNVRQIWLQPEIVSNVVNYTVVVDAHNPDGVLLPGMTATVDFVIDERENVLKVPNAALRFDATAEMMMEMAEKHGVTGERQRGPGSRGSGPASRPDRAEGPPELPEGFAALWYFDENDELAVTVVEKGVSDGKSTEIIGGDGVVEGMQVVSAAVGTSATEASEQGGRGMMGMMRMGGGPPR